LDAGGLHRQAVQDNQQISTAGAWREVAGVWGTKARLDTLFGAKATVAAQKYFAFRYKSPKHWVELFRGYYGPVLKAFAAIDPQAREALEADLYALLGEINVARDGSLVAPSEYLEVVITKNR
jgi:hypothetical protein